MTAFTIEDRIELQKEVLESGWISEAQLRLALSNLIRAQVEAVWLDQTLSGKHMGPIQRRELTELLTSDGKLLAIDDFE